MKSYGSDLHIAVGPEQWIKGGHHINWFPDGVPLRWIDLNNKTEQTLVRINVANSASKENSSFRVDPHPAWSPDFNYFAFNGYINGTRAVFVAGMKSFFISI